MKTKLIVHPHELDTDWIDRMAELGTDVLGIHPEGGQKSHESVASSLALFATPQYRALIDYAHARNLQVHYELHAARYLLPSQLFSQHPDWFRMDENGKRVADFHFCASNPEALSFVAQRAVELTQQLYGSTPDYFLWLDDVKNCFCHCPKCRTMSPPDQNLTVMNAIVGALRKEQPNANLAYLAYYESVKPPTQVKPAPGIFLEYAPFERYYPRAVARPIDESDRAELQELLKVFDAQTAWILEYWLDNSYYTRRANSNLPIPFTPDNARIRTEAKWYLQNGIDQLSTFACFLGKSYWERYGMPDLSSMQKNKIGENT